MTTGKVYYLSNGKEIKTVSLGDNTVATLKVDGTVGKKEALEICKAFYEIFNISLSDINNFDESENSDNKPNLIDVEINTTLLSNPPQCGYKKMYCNQCDIYKGNVGKNGPYCRSSGMFMAKSKEKEHIRSAEDSFILG